MRPLPPGKIEEINAKLAAFRASLTLDDLHLIGRALYDPESITDAEETLTDALFERFDDVLGAAHSAGTRWVEVPAA